ncbi:hypothetical protein Scep_027370 [Stephania cephalantha]|uniref:Secreted protein n=1 Tax=Stephania cephalantha TaxID=152367 RepID=A0AAP0HH71_9MAGN
MDYLYATFHLAPRVTLSLAVFLLQSTCRLPIGLPTATACISCLPDATWRVQIRPRVPAKAASPATLCHVSHSYSPLASAADACLCKAAKGSCPTNAQATRGVLFHQRHHSSPRPIAARHVTASSLLAQSKADTWQRPGSKILTIV